MAYTYKTTAQIIKKIGIENLSLYRGEGYYYFVYDNKGSVYETYTVMVCYLTQMPMPEWIHIGKAFAAAVENGTYDAFNQRF